MMKSQKVNGWLWATHPEYTFLPVSEMAGGRVLHMSEEIQIVVNGFPEVVRAESTVAELIVHFQETDAHLIVEVNGRFIYPSRYDSLFIQEGDRVEFINPNFGG